MGPGPSGVVAFRGLVGDGRIGGLASPGEVHGARGLGRTRRDGASTVDGAPGVALADRGFRGDAEADEGRVPVRLLPLDEVPVLAEVAVALEVDEDLEVLQRRVAG